MNNHHLEMTNQMGKIMVSCALEDEGDLDVVAFKILRNDCPQFVAGFSSVEVNGKITLRYDVGNMISLAYYSAKLSKSEFAAVWSSLLTPLMQCRDWLLGYNSFCFDPQYIFIDRHTNIVKYIYLPLNSAVVDDDEIKSMFMGMMERCELVDGQDLQVELYKLFAQRSFSLGELNNIISRHMTGTGNLVTPQPTEAPVRQAPPPAAAPTPVQQAPAAMPTPAAPPPPPAVAVPPAGAWQPKETKLTPEEELERQLLGSLGGKPDKPTKPGKPAKPAKPEKVKQEKKPLFIFGKKPDRAPVSQPAAQYTAPQMQQPINSYAVQPSMVAQVADDSTVMLDEIGASTGGCSLRLANNTAPADLPRVFNLDLSRGGASIGRHDASKGMRQCDIEFPVTVKSVSRIHARIERQGTDCILVDLGSANGTFLNGMRLAANVPTAIKSGDRIGFSDKGIDYIFTF